MAGKQIKPSTWWPSLNRLDSTHHGLVGYWPLWEGAGPQAADVAGLFPGTLDAGTDWVSQGILTDANGDDVSIPGIAARMTGSTAFTMMTVVNLESEGIGTIFGYFFSLSDVSQSEARISFSDTGQRVFAVLNGTGISAGVGSWPGFNRDVVVIARYSAGETNGSQIWLNGELKGSATISGAISISGNGLIANRADGLRALDGTTKACAVWDRALSSPEIEQISYRPYGLITPPNNAAILSAGVAAPAAAVRRNMTLLGVG